MEKYIHEVKYYETDMMGVTHHSNYFRFMEEARIDFMNQIGYPYKAMEELGVISPVISADGKFKKSSTFADILTIDVKVIELSGIVLKFEYEIKNQKDELVFIGHSEHCFLTKDGKIVRVNKEYPDFYETVRSYIE